MHDQFVLTAPYGQQAINRGIATMFRAISPTLGPTPRSVMIAPASGARAPEVLDDAVTIARRTSQLPDPYEDMGNQLVRQMTNTVFERAGDGTATAVVLMHAIVREAAIHLAAGSSVLSVTNGIVRGLAAARIALKRQAREIETPAEIAGAVSGAIRDAELAAMIGEILEAVGPDGAVLVEEADRTETTFEYIDGVRWNEGYVSHFLLKEGKLVAEALNPRILITDYPLERAEAILPALVQCVAAGERSIMIIAPEIRDAALGLLITNRERGVLQDVVAVKAPGLGEQRSGILQDLAVITGARFIQQALRDDLASVTLADLGVARQAWATRFSFGIIGGRGTKAAIRQRIGALKGELRQTRDDQYAREKLQERIGKLAGLSAVIRIGTANPRTRKDLKARVEAAITVGRHAMNDGVVPGGGAALVACVPALAAVECPPHEFAGIRILMRALTEPMRVIAENAGLEPGPIVSAVQRHPAGWTYDVLRREWVDAMRVGLVDPLAVTLAALETSVSAAKMALTTETLIRHKRPSIAIEP